MIFFFTFIGQPSPEEKMLLNMEAAEKEKLRRLEEAALSTSVCTYEEPSQATKAIRARGAETIPTLPEVVQEAIEKGCVFVGMSEYEVALSWGNPIRRNNSTSARSKNSQYVYKRNRYLYFQDGELTSIQH